MEERWAEEAEEEEAEARDSESKTRTPHKVVGNHHFLWVSEVTLGTFGVQF